MSQVAFAPGAADLDPAHAVAAVLDFLDRLALDRRGEARPAAAAFILGLAREQRRAAPSAAMFARRLVAEQLAGARRFGAGLAQDAVALVAELLAPLGFGRGYVGHGSAPILKLYVGGKRGERKRLHPLPVLSVV